ncbi:hypothetical protein JL722_14519 [Aureococcus anophagefferens]|nr:hypothetical protein JL722_14519 [Aureococcus anophagefferens]
MATATKTGGIPGLKPIMMGLVGFPFLVRAWMGLCGQFHDIPYKDADCMLKLINETNKAHYDAHPLWPHLSYESDCDSVDYARRQAKENWHESKMMNAFVISEWALAAKWLLRDGLSFETLLFGWVAGMNTQYTMHYQHDLTQFVGNLVHHGGEGLLEETGAGGAGQMTEKGKSVPHGQAPSLVACEIMIQSVAYLAHKIVNPRAPFGSYFGARAFISVIKMRFQTLLVHPYVHAEEKSIFPWPLSEIIEDHKCHIVNHHVDGSCLGVIDFAPMNRLYDGLMYFQASFYQSGAVKRRTPGHWVLTFGMEYCLIALTFATFAGYMATAKAIKGGPVAKSVKTA